MNCGSHPNQKKIITPWHDGFPPQASLEARRGSAVFTTMLTGTDPLLATPRQEQRGSSQVIRRLNHSLPASVKLVLEKSFPQRTLVQLRG